MQNANNIKMPTKPSWWNGVHCYEYHRNKGHRTNGCQRLKNLVQDILDKGDIMVEGHNDHKAFKIPLPNYDKGGPSTLNDK